MVQMNAKNLQSAISRKSSKQIALVDSNPCGFRIKPASKAKDSDFESVDFIGVFSPKVTLNTIRKELKLQKEILNDVMELEL